MLPGVGVRRHPFGRTLGFTPPADARRSQGDDTSCPTRSGSPLWDPFHELGELRERMSGLLARGGLTGAVVGTAWSPLADLEETDDAYLIDVDVPGVKRDDINVEVTDREIAISGEYKERERSGALRRGTRRIGRFEYRAVLPGEINTEGVDATLSDGGVGGPHIQRRVQLARAGEHTQRVRRVLKLAPGLRTDARRTPEARPAAWSRMRDATWQPSCVSVKRGGRLHRRTLAWRGCTAGRTVQPGGRSRRLRRTRGLRTRRRGSGPAGPPARVLIMRPIRLPAGRGAPAHAPPAPGRAQRCYASADRRPGPLAQWRAR